MKLSLLLRHLHPDVLLRLDGISYSIAEIETRLARGQWPGGEPEMVMVARSRSFDLYQEDQYSRQRHCGWVERAWSYHEISARQRLVHLVSPDGRNVWLGDEEGRAFLEAIKSLASVDQQQAFMAQNYADRLED